MVYIKFALRYFANLSRATGDEAEILVPITGELLSIDGFVFQYFMLTG